MIEDLQKASPFDGSVVLYYICQYESRKQQTDAAILRSMICQLLRQSGEDVVEAVEKLKTRHHSDSDLNHLSSILTAACKGRSVYLVLDALDELECPRGIIRRVQSFLDTGCKVMLTSRLHPDISQAFSKHTQIEVFAALEDIRTFIEHKFAASDFAEDIGRGHMIIELAALKSRNMSEPFPGCFGLNN